MSSTNEFVYILRPARADMLRTGPTPREAEVIGRHFGYLQELCSRGTVALAGRTTTDDERAFGICILRATDLSAARAIMLADPAVESGVMSAELFPFRIALMSSSTTP